MKRVYSVASSLALLLLSGLVCAEEPPLQPPEGASTYFPREEDWRLQFGTDTTFTASNEAEGSTNESNDGTSRLDPILARLRASLRHRTDLELTVDVLSANGGTLEIYGLHARLQPDRRIGLRVGVLPLVVGGWQDRAYPDRQPLINQPLLSQILLPLRNDTIPASTDELLSQRGRRGETQYSLGEAGTGAGIAVFYERCWNPGAELLGEIGGFRYRAAAMAGPPGSPLVKARDHVAGPSFEGRLVWRRGEALRLGVSYARGPYLQDRLDPFVPVGREASDFQQQLAGGDVRLRFGRFELVGEAVRNTFDSPWVRERLETWGGYGEVSFRATGSLEFAGRLSVLQHSDVVSSRGARQSWEADSERLELGGTYRMLDRHLAAKAAWQRTRLDLAPRLVEDVVALQLAISY